MVNALKNHNKTSINKTILLAIALFAVANLFFVNIISAKKLDLDDKAVDRIKTTLGIMQLLNNLALGEDKLKLILNTAIKGANAGTDVTYGLVVLTALNEMDFIDMVLSQRFKEEAREYFNSILDERLNLIGYYKGIGYDLPRILSGKITGPMSGLTLNTFSITDKTISIFTTLNVLREEKTYEGLWFYFDLRMSNESHEIAWSDAKDIMGFEITQSIFSRKMDHNEISQLESQFSSLWDKWGQYATPQGLSNDFKKQAKSELNETLVSAIENEDLSPKKENSIVKFISGYSKWILELAQNTFQKAYTKIRSTVTELTQYTPASIVQYQQYTQQTEISVQEEKKEQMSNKEERIINENPTLDEIQDSLDDLIENVDILSQQFNQTSTASISKPKQENNIEPGEKPEFIEIEIQKEISKVIEPTYCAANENIEPLKHSLIINEIAWMGTSNSANDEWIELKNISENSLNITNWQLIDQKNDIRLIFSKELTMLPSEILILERTNDDTIPAVNAYAIYKGALENQNESLYLFDSECRLQDKIIATSNWPAGNNDTKRTMERTKSLEWQTSFETGGTPGKENSEGYYIGGYVAKTPPPQEQTPQPPTLYISEIQISTASSTDYDFIEIYNPSGNQIDVSGFQLKKKSSTGSESSIRVFPTESIISGQGYFLWINSEYASNSSIIADITSSQTLAKNNSVALFDSSGSLIDSVAWGESLDQFVETSPFNPNPNTNKSLGRKWTIDNYTDSNNNSSDFEIQNPTPKARNITPEPESPSMTVVINEIAWMGTNNTNSSDEWIELYNNTTSTIDITSWTLTAEDESPSIIFPTATIAANGYYLIERTDDSAVSDTTADWFGSFGSGGLKNDGENLELRNAEGSLIDTVNASTGWFAGSTTPAYISMERINASATGSESNNWATNNIVTRNGLSADGQKVNGTPKSQNSVSKSETQILSLPFDEFNEITLTYLGNPYIIQNSLTVPSGKKLIIEPASIIKFYLPVTYSPGDGSSLTIQGSLEAKGSPGQEITLTSTGNLWPGLIFDDNEIETETSSWLEYVNIQKARSWEAGNYFAVKIYQKSVSIKNSIFNNESNLRGVVIENSSSTIENSSFSNFTGGANGSGEYPSAIYITGGSSKIINNTFTGNYNGITFDTTQSCNLNPGFSITGNTFTDGITPIYSINYGMPCFSQNSVTNPYKDGLTNVINGILVKNNTTISQDAYWSADMPIIVEQNLMLNNATLTLPAGTNVKFKYTNSAIERSYLKIDNNGRLITLGETENPVSFSSAKEIPNAGNWQALHFKTASYGNLNYTTIGYGGFGAGDSHNECLVIESLDVIQNNVTKEFCTPY